MSVIIVVGAQWGDEGKGKIVDVFAQNADIIVRPAGGANAGHNVWVGGLQYVTHILPSGLPQKKICILGAAMVIDPEQLLREMDCFQNMGMEVSPRTVMISPSAQIVLPTHKAIDAAREAERGSASIGTTRQGISPAYGDAVSRNGLRAEMMLEPLRFSLAVAELVRRHGRELVSLGARPFDDREISTLFQDYANRLAPYVQDTSLFIHSSLREGKTVLVEGAQGTLLDINHGGYPYVTSSSTVAGAACAGLGIGPTNVSRVIGVTKAYQTRVGEGPMPTEIKADQFLMNHLRGFAGQPGSEFGATTGRARRVGWLDLPLLRYAARINGFTDLVLTKLDVLAGLREISVCVGYRDGDKLHHNLPVSWSTNLHRFVPVYKCYEGWTDIASVRRFEDLPDSAKRYVEMIEQEVGVPISMVSVGVDREAIIRR